MFFAHAYSKVFRDYSYVKEPKYEPINLWGIPEKVVSQLPKSIKTPTAHCLGVIISDDFFILNIPVLTPNGLDVMISILSLFYIDKVLE